jgi:predicted P-loop ATPase
VQILTHDAAYADKLRLDEMRGVVTIGDVEVTDAAIGAIRVDFENRYGFQAGDAETARAVQLVAAKNAFHPVRDFINSLKWDGVPRLDDVASRILRARADSEDERALLALLVRRWFIAFVARPLSPGCKVDTALILEGAQGGREGAFPIFKRGRTYVAKRSDVDGYIERQRVPVGPPPEPEPPQLPPGSHDPIAAALAAGRLRVVKKCP